LSSHFISPAHDYTPAPRAARGGPELAVIACAQEADAHERPRKTQGVVD